MTHLDKIKEERDLLARHIGRIKAYIREYPEMSSEFYYTLPQLGSYLRDARQRISALEARDG